VVAAVESIQAEHLEQAALVEEVIPVAPLVMALLTLEVAVVVQMALPLAAQAVQAAPAS
jgi:hypothetical protein